MLVVFVFKFTQCVDKSTIVAAEADHEALAAEIDIDLACRRRTVRGRPGGRTVPYAAGQESGQCQVGAP